MPVPSSSSRRGRPYRSRRPHHSGGSGSSSRPPRGKSSSYNKTKTNPKANLSWWQKLLQLFGIKSQKKVTKNSSFKKESNPQRRQPRPEEVETPRLYIGNLSFETTESDLFELFSGVGTVQNVEVVSYRDTMRSKGFGFIQMTTVDEAKRAVEELHDKDYMGRKLVVSGARDIPESRKTAS